MDLFRGQPSTSDANKSHDLTNKKTLFYRTIIKINIKYKFCNELKKHFMHGK